MCPSIGILDVVINHHPTVLELSQQGIAHLNKRMTGKEKESKRKNNLIFIGSVVLPF